jgi:fission 1 protein
MHNTLCIYVFDIQDCERDAAKEGVGLSQGTDTAESYMRLSWALVHSRQPADVQRGILMLEGLTFFT